MRNLVIIAATVLASASVEARLYQWNNPNTGTPQLSGSPPAWYRQGSGGPRISVYDRGRLIDDTSRAVSETERRHLREEAFGIQEREEALAMETKQADRTEAVPKDKPGARPPAPVGLPGAGGALPTVVLPKPGEAPPGGAAISDGEVAHMKEIIATWEQQRTAQAQALVGNQPAVQTLPDTGSNVPAPNPVNGAPPADSGTADAGSAPNPPGIVNRPAVNNLTPAQQNQAIQNALLRALNTPQPQPRRPDVQRY